MLDVVVAHDTRISQQVISPTSHVSFCWQSLVNTFEIPTVVLAHPSGSRFRDPGR